MERKICNIFLAFFLFLVFLVLLVFLEKLTNAIYLSNMFNNIINISLQEEIEHLQEEIAKLKSNYVFLLKELSLFASNGDLSENADWMLVNEKKELLYQEICQKEFQLAGLKNNSIKKQEVVYLLLATGEEKRVLLTEAGSDPSRGCISFDSFLGSVLSGEKEGNIKRVCTGQMIYEIKILSKKWV